MGFDDEDEFGTVPEDDEQPQAPVSRIARPNMAASSLPAVTARPLAPPTPETGSTEDLENQGLQSHLTPPRIAAPATPSPLQSRTAADQSELDRLQKTGSGVSQVKNRFGRGLLRGLDVAGSIIAPAQTMMIPGTTLHHNLLEHQQQRQIGEDLGEQAQEGGLGKTQADTEEAQARTDQANAAAEKDRAAAAAAGQPKPKEEKWTVNPNFTDTDGTPLKSEENSGQLVRATDGKPPTGVKAAKTPADKAGTKVTRIVNGVPHEVLVDSVTGEDIKDEGQTKVPGESADDKRSAAEQAQVEREARGNIRKAEGQLRATQQTVGQLNSSIDAAKDGNGLLTSFVPTMEVLGINAASGVHRISPAEAQAAQLPGGFVERFNAFVDKAATGKLSPELQQEGKALGHILMQGAYQRYKSTYDDETGMVSGYGVKDFGKRVALIPGEEQSSGGGLNPPKAADPGMKWQHRSGANGQVEWRQVPAQ